MPSNAEAAEVFRHIADLLDVLGERFKPEAYRRAARSIETLTEDLSRVAARNELATIPGVGEAIAEKIREYLSTGQVHYYERLKREVPPGLVEIMRLPGLGPKTARRFWVELGIEGASELSDAIAAGRLDSVKGFGARKIDLIRTALEQARTAPAAHREPIEVAYPVAERIVRALRARSRSDRVEAAGSFRRRRETVGDLDILVTSDEPAKVFDTFSALPEVREVRMRGGTKETVVLASGLQVDLRVVEPAAFGAAMQYFTGSKDHNVRLRSLARDQGLKVNEYGVYRGEERVAGRTEADVYAALGLAWIPPELREDRGEVAAAASGRLPTLVETTDLVCDPHVHLSASAEPAELERLVVSARSRAIGSLGVVATVVRDGERRWTAPERLLHRIRSGGGPVRLLAVVEVEGTGFAGAAAAVAELDAAYVVLAPGPGSATPLDVGTARVALVAHVGGGTEAARPAIELARTLGAAVEVGPGADRLDSTMARSALEAGVALSLPLGAGEPEANPTAAVALGFARRAGATRERVLNARELAGPAPTARRPPRPSHRRR
jgi:DNA polymerase (family X)